MTRKDAQEKRERNRERVGPFTACRRNRKRERERERCGHQAQAILGCVPAALIPLPDKPSRLKYVKFSQGLQVRARLPRNPYTGFRV